MKNIIIILAALLSYNAVFAQSFYAEPQTSAAFWDSLYRHSIYSNGNHSDDFNAPYFKQDHGNLELNIKLADNKKAEYSKKTKSYLPTIIAGLAGATFMGLGFSKNSDAKKSYDNYIDEASVVKSGMSSQEREKNYDNLWSKIESDKKTRNIFYALGGVSFALGVVLWF